MTTENENEIAGAAGAGAGAVMGCGGGIALIIIGIVLSATGIGALIGIPCILAGIFMPLVGAARGATTFIGNCPHCDSRISASTFDKAVTCPICRNRILCDGETLTFRKIT